MSRPSPEKLVDDIIATGQIGSTVCGKLDYIHEALRLLRERVPDEYRFEVEAAEQYRDDFATFDAIHQFLFNGINEQKKHLILTVRAWHGYRDYFDYLIMICLRRVEVPSLDLNLSLNISLVFVFPPEFKNGREIEQSDKLAHRVARDSTLKLMEYMVGPSAGSEHLDSFSRKFESEYVGSEQQKDDRARPKQPPGSFLCREQKRKKRDGKLDPRAYSS